MRGLRIASFLICATPALWLARDAWRGQLGINPLAHLLHQTGSWALILLLVTLAVTPLRRLSMIVAKSIRARYGKRISDWNALIRLRRQFGLFAFFYASLHLAIYLAFDVGIDVAAIVDDVRERPFIALGLLGWALMLPLAATSHQAAMRRLGGAWRKLHRLTYLVAVLAFVHLWLQAKVGQWTALPYTAALGVLLLARATAWRLGDRGPGAEVAPRS